MRSAFAFACAPLLATLAASAVPAQVAVPRVYAPQESINAPQIDLWLDQASYRLGDRIAPHFVTEPGAYVTVVRVTTDGQLRVLYPQRPQEQRPFRKGQLVNDRVPYNSLDNRFEVYESRGTGFIFAVASFSRFDYSYFTSGGEWSVARLANDGRYGDPFEIAHRFVDRTLKGNSDFSMDYVSYEVYNEGARSRYASRYYYDSYDDYYGSCISAFGMGYSPYCGRYYPGAYPIIVSQPQAPRRDEPRGGNYAGKHIRPLTGDPLVHGAPSDPQLSSEGRLPDRNRAEEAAAASRRERMLRDATPRDRGAPTIDTRPMLREPRIYTAAPERPRYESPRIEPSRPTEPRIEPRIETRAEPRQQPSAPPRVEMRPQPAPSPRIEQVARPAAAPVEKDHLQ